MKKVDFQAFSCNHDAHFYDGREVLKDTLRKCGEVVQSQVAIAF